MKTETGIEMPRRATRESAGYDFFAPEDIVLKAGEWTEIGTGVRLTDDDEVEIPRAVCDVRQDRTGAYMSMSDRWLMLLVPKSGLGFRYGVRMVNTCGIIDMDYRGEIRAKLTCDTDVTIRKGEKFMQGILLPFGIFVDEIIPTEERAGGFGSTGA